jgi:hypothetical protein
MNTEIVKRAEAIASRDGGHWSQHLQQAEQDLRNDARTLQKQVTARDGNAAMVEENLRKDAVAASIRHLPDGGLRRIVIGEVDIEKVGRIHVEHDQQADVILLQGIRFKLGDIDNDLRSAFCAGSAAFNAAQDSAEQTTARTLVGLVVRAILERHDKFIGAKVREQALNVRYGV